MNVILNITMMQLVIILDNIRSAHNVGAILRTCDAAGTKKVICCGTTPYPRLVNDQRDPVIINRNTREITKTALGAEQSISIEYKNDAISALAPYRAKGWTIYGLERKLHATGIMNAVLSSPAVLILGSETHGLSQELMGYCDEILQIPQWGDKESLNVAVAAGIAIYQFRKTEPN